MPVLNIFTSPTTKVEIPVGVDDHGDLSGLTDDDHIIYFLADGTRVLTGEMNAGANTIGFTQQIITYNSSITTADWTKGNKARMVFGAGNITTFAFTNPTNDCDIKLVIVQDGTGGRTVTNWDTDILWVNGTIPTLSTGANAVDVLSGYWDGTNYLCVLARRFA